MTTTINGRPAEWPPGVLQKWQAATHDPSFPGGTVTWCNYFTPRPFRNEWDRGSTEEGFCYIARRGPERGVFVVTL